MFVFNTTQKVGGLVQRHRRTMPLEQSVRELFSLYESLGGFSPAALDALVRQIDRCLSQAGLPKAQAQQHLYILMRAQDLHRYLAEEPELTGLKQQLLEHVLFYRTMEERWAAIRALLLASMDLICQSPLPGTSVNLTHHKEALSRRGSRMGKLLTLTALLIFDLDEERPPVNLMLRFQRGSFPLHTWEAAADAGKGTLQHAAVGWSPANPLCRWEYLGLDLMHALFRERLGAERPAVPAFEWCGPEASATGKAEVTVYCRLHSAAQDAPEAAQLELLPLDPQTFLPEVQRGVHRRWGGEGLHLFALLMARLHRSRPGEVVVLHPAEVLGLAAVPGATPRALRERVKRLWRLLEALAGVELLRVAQGGRGGTAESSRLITVISHSGDWCGAAPGAPHTGKKGGAGLADLRVQLLVDPVFYPPQGGTLAEPYRDPPGNVASLPPREHPLALSLMLFLRQAWAREWPARQGVLKRSAAGLFQEAGLWMSPGSRYKAIETLKRELTALHALGVLGQWRLERSATRDALDDTYRLVAPRSAGATAGGAVAPRAGTKYRQGLG